MQTSILIADDEADLVALLADNLQRAGFAVLTAYDGYEALVTARRELPASILLDARMPELSGLEVCQILKGEEGTALIPILMISGESSEEARVAAFELGVDDYITKPFSPREVVLRVRAILRRVPVPGSVPVPHRVGQVAIDHERHEVTVGGQEVQLTAIEYKLLRAFAERPGEVLTREELLHEIWEKQDEIGKRTIDTHLRRLRDKLGPCAGQITTARGLGYSFSAV